MTFGRYQMLRLMVGLPLLIVLMFLAYALIGHLTAAIPAGIAVGIGILAWIGGTMFGTHLIAKSLRRRWDR
jgi:membrane associated rhomboid family serine protease